MNHPPTAQPRNAPSLIDLLRKNPIAFIKRALHKVFIGPLRYGKGGKYDAVRFWRDRFSKYGLSLQGSGDEGFDERENRAMYAAAAAAMLESAKEAGVTLTGRTVLDIGCGPGFYAGVLDEMGVIDYTGVDLTSVLFPQLEAQFPEYRFVAADATTENLAQKLQRRFDVILLLDVIQNIVTPEKFDALMVNVKNLLAEGGMCLIAPVMPETKKHLFYMHFWSLPDLQRNFPGFRFGRMIPYRHDHIVSVTVPE
jgi:2-polyprenyl-3-methyl-5-hydroxy-6-metoxy-1,4-benzoquinol methylase